MIPIKTIPYNKDLMFNREEIEMVSPKIRKKKVLTTNADSTVINLKLFKTFSTLSSTIKSLRDPLKNILQLFRITPKIKIMIKDER